VSELAKYNLGLGAVQEAKWDNDGSEPSRQFYIFLWKWESQSSLTKRFSYIRESYQHVRG